jgi:hypothetical protein
LHETNMTLAKVRAAMRSHGARDLFVKRLSPNDNSKNQIYLGGDFRVINLLPAEAPVATTSGTHDKPIFKSALRLSWLDDAGDAFPAPDAQLILYPQYPEVRMSGFLRGASWSPSALLASRDSGRVLLLGVTADGRILGYAAAAESQVEQELRLVPVDGETGVLARIALTDDPTLVDSRTRLLEALCRVAKAGWIPGWRLYPDGSRRPCTAQNCVGVTLESELGITANSYSEPDFEGWEVKAHTVANFDRTGTGAVTLMTPEPTGGAYTTLDIVEFVRRYGYTDKRGRPDRMNFGGIHKVGRRCAATGLTLTLSGYDASSGKMTDSAGSLALLDDAGEVAASWDFAGLLAHWSRKHSRAVFVPAMKESAPSIQFRYGHHVLLAEGTDYTKVLRGLADGTVYYDPGIKVEYESGTPKAKKRSQIRVSRSKLETLYHRTARERACLTHKL